MGDPPSGSPEAIVVGGGFAGLAAATALAERGARVVVLEGRAHLGGRARSWVDPGTGSVVDNGQHLFMGCYHETLAFLRRVGSLDGLDLQPRLALHLVEKGGAVGTFRLPSLPAPLDMIGGLLRYPGLGWSGRLGALRVARAAGRLSRGGRHGPAVGLDGTTVDAWLAALRQTPEANLRLWHPIAIAALNEDPAIASAAMFVPVLRQAFLAGGSSSRLGLARVGLTDLYARPAAHYLRAKGSTVRLRTPVRRLLFEGGRCVGALLGDGTRLESGAVVAAVPPEDLLEILPPDVATEPFFARAGKLETSPIVSVYLWFGAPVTDLPFAGLLGGTWHWIFNRQALSGGVAGSHPVTLVCSAARDLVGRPVEALVRLALEDLRTFFPQARRAAPRRSLVIKEKRATLSPRCGAVDLRPPFHTPYRGLHLAGDWTATGLPATIEGAVLSGHACAARALEDAPG